METDLNARLRAYFETAEPRPPADPALRASALQSSLAAAAAASAAIVSSHARELNPWPPPGFVPAGQKELDFLIGGKSPDHPATEADQPAAETAPSKNHLPLRPAANALENLALGAAGIPALKAQNG